MSLKKFQVIWRP